ncbi:hypothetical protein [Streptomyces sp. NPDC002537]
MLAYVAPLWIGGVACLVAAAVGNPVKLGGAEIPAIPTTAARWTVALIGVAAIVLGTVLFRHEGSPSDGGSSGGGSVGGGSVGGAGPLPPPVRTSPPVVHPPAPPRTPPTEPPTTDPAPPTAPPAVRVRWHGTLTLDDGSANGMPTTGWSLDPVPPQRAPLGDLGLACQLSCAPGQLVSNTIVVWTGSTPPKRQQCVDLLNTHPGQRTADVPAGSLACFGTEAGRVGFLKSGGGGRSGRQSLDVTVWELPP